MVNIKIEKITNGYLVDTDYGYELKGADGRYLDGHKEFAGNADAIRDCLARIGIKLQNVDWSEDGSD